MGLELSLSAVRSNASAPPSAATFDRLPVLIGRDPAVASFALSDAGVSRVHASVDVRGGRLCIRDAGSTNGTIVGGQRIPSNRWIAAGTLDRPCEIRIGEWVIVVTARESASAVHREGGAENTAFLGSYAPETVMAAQTAQAGARPARSGDAPSTPPPPANATVARPAALVARAYAVMMAARSELVTVLTETLEGARPAERAQLADEIMRTCSALAGDAGVRSLLERYSGQVLAPTFDAAAGIALQELARWYVGTRPPPSTPRDAFAFARKIKAGIDELLTGLVPLFASLDRFEQQMAVRPRTDSPPTNDAAASARLPRTPRDAARVLFDWNDPTDGGVRAMRTDLVDLTLHQVAVLNGMMRGVKVLLAELAPGTLDQAWQKRQRSRGVIGRMLGSLRASSEKWALHRERYSDLADEENERFRVIFGPEFVAEYKAAGHFTAHLTPAKPARSADAAARGNWAPQGGRPAPPPMPSPLPPPSPVPFARVPAMPRNPGDRA